MVVVREEQETHVVEEEEQPRLFVVIVETEKTAQSWTAELETHGRQVCYKLDTGSQVNVLPRNVYDSLKSPPALMPTLVKLMSYGSSVPLLVDGQCLCEVKYGIMVKERLDCHFLLFLQDRLRCWDWMHVRH